MASKAEVDHLWAMVAKETKLSVSDLRGIVSRLEQHGLIHTTTDMVVAAGAHQSQDSLLSILCKDELTGLCNRRYFTAKIDRHIKECATTNRTFALFFVDIDGFKAVNDTLGHSTGDKILKLVAKNLRLCIRHGDELARIHGDEFLVMFDAITSINDVITLANKILKSTKRLMHEGRRVNISASVGIALFPSPGLNTLEDMIDMADHAMYQSKKRGKNCFTIYGT